MIIYATNIHYGGGKVLLDELLQKRMFGEIHILFCDQRYNPPQCDYPVEVIRVEPNLSSRLKAEFSLKRKADLHGSSPVLCFGNLPPLFKLKNRTIVYVQNAFSVPGSK